MSRRSIFFLMLLMPGLLCAGTLTVTDSNGVTYQLTIADPIEVTASGALRVPIGEQISGSANQPPVALDDMDTVPNTSIIDVAVLANDSDPDGTLNTSSVTLVGPSVGGSFVVQGSGEIRYTPSNGFIGTATQDYRVADNQGGLSNIATLSIGVTGAACPSDPLPGYSRRPSPTTFDHCNFNIGVSLGLRADEYYALEMNMNACPEMRGRMFWVAQVGSGQPLRVTISQCPGVMDDSEPPIPGDPYVNICSSPAIGESVLPWTIANNDFECRIEPGQRVYLNIVYGDNQNPPNPTCDQGICGFVMTPTQ